VELTKYVFLIRGQKWWTLSEEKYQELKKAYPTYDVDCELRKMVHWCKVNKRRRKTAKGMYRFITNWVGRSEEVGHVSERPPETAPEPYEDRSLRKYKETYRTLLDGPREAILNHRTFRGLCGLEPKLRAWALELRPDLENNNKS